MALMGTQLHNWLQVNSSKKWTAFYHQFEMHKASVFSRLFSIFGAHSLHSTLIRTLVGDVNSRSWMESHLPPPQRQYVNIHVYLLFRLPQISKIYRHIILLKMISLQRSDISQQIITPHKQLFPTI